MDPIAVAKSALGVLNAMKEKLQDCQTAKEEARSLLKDIVVFEVTLMMIPTRAPSDETIVEDPNGKEGGNDGRGEGGGSADRNEGGGEKEGKGTAWTLGRGGDAKLYPILEGASERLEGLRSASEALQSANEKLQSASERLQSASDDPMKMLQNPLIQSTATQALTVAQSAAPALLSAMGSVTSAVSNASDFADQLGIGDVAEFFKLCEDDDVIIGVNAIQPCELMKKMKELKDGPSLLGPRRHER